MSIFRLPMRVINSQVGVLTPFYTPPIASDLALYNQWPFPGNGSFLNAVATGTVTFLLNSDSFFLSGSIIPTLEIDLPTGFHVLDALVNASFQAGAGAQYRIKIGADTAASNLTTMSFVDIPPLTLNSMLATIVGFNWDIGPSGILIFPYAVTGNYDIISARWVINNITHPGLNFEVGDIAQITSDDGSYNGFASITEVDLDAHAVTTFTLQSATEIRFVIPTLIDDTYLVSVTDSGVQFSGSAVVGPLTVITIDSSGLYRIVPDKTHDTLYLDSSVNGTTFNTKIPNPFAKTGFIGR